MRSFALRPTLAEFVSAVRVILERASDKRAAARDLSRLFYSGKLPAGMTGTSLGAALWKDPGRLARLREVRWRGAIDAAGLASSTRRKLIT